MKNLLYYSDTRHATWLELFFDLIFVVALGAVTHNLAHTHHDHIPLSQMGAFILELVPVWWIWASHTIYANRFDTDSRPRRLLTLVIMLFMAAISVFISEGLDDNFRGFALCYAVIRFIMAAKYAVLHDASTGMGGFARALAPGIFAGGLLACVAAFISGPLQFVVLFVGIALEALLHLFAYRKIPESPAHRAHLVERIGLISIIILGESMISLAAGLRGVAWDSNLIGTALTGFVMVAAIWWIYFDGLHILERAKRIKHGQALIFANLFLTIGLLVLADLIRFALLHNLESKDFQILAIAGMTAFYLGKQIPYYLALPKFRINIWINSLVCIAITVASTFLPKIEYALAGITFGMLFYTFSNYRWTLTKDVEEYLEHQHLSPPDGLTASAG